VARILSRSGDQAEGVNLKINGITVAVTGAAGFIGYHVADMLQRQGARLLLIDNLNEYYSPQLKLARLHQLGIPAERRAGWYSGPDGVECFIGDINEPDDRFREHFAVADVVLHFAAQAGVRYSIEHPMVYHEANVRGFQSMLDLVRDSGIGRVIYASSSSVYGDDTTPFSEAAPVDHPLSVYAATKRMNELLAYVYARLYSIQFVGLRLFTVYGPWGRPDMAYYQFAKCIDEGRPITLHENGEMLRDFTYIDDVVEVVQRFLVRMTDGEAERPFAGNNIFNVGNHSPQSVTKLVRCLETQFGKKATIETANIQPGESRNTYADTAKLHETLGFVPATNLEQGVASFAEWYKNTGAGIGAT
jgi:UDP-glucuronate 4-epimerase